jgi:predicted permease
MYRDLRDRNSVFEGVIATSWAQAGVAWHGQPELVNAELVSGNYFDVLGVRAALGRLFVASDDVAPNANPIALLNFGYWQRQFGSSPAILNQTIHVNSHPFTIVGVVEPRFHSAVVGDTPDIFVPMTMRTEIVPGWSDLENRNSSWLNIIARLRPETSKEQAAAAMSGLWHSIRTEELKQSGSHSQAYIEHALANSRLEILPGSKGLSSVRKDVGAPLIIIFCMAGVMALMASANVGSMLLVRAAGRTREMSVRYALGARPQRVFRQLLVEGLLLGLTAAVAGILLAPQFSSVLARIVWADDAAGDLPVSSHLDLRIIAFNFGLAILVSVLFSFAPALQFWRPDLTSALKQQVVSTGGPLHFRRISVAVQIGLSMLLLVTAGLFVRTLRNLESLDVGFATDHLVTFEVDPTLAGYPPEKAGDVETRILQTMAALPGVHAVAATTDPELKDDSSGNNVTIPGYVPKEGENMNVEHARISTRYFSAMQMPLVVGREFTDQDRDGTEHVAVVNQSFARRFFGDVDHALGRNFGNGGGNVKTDIQIVGVVKDARHAGVRQDIVPTIFTPYLQELQFIARHTGGMGFYVRTWQDPPRAEQAIRQAVLGINSQLVLEGLRTMREQVDGNLVAERVISLLASAFGILAVIMAAVGLYGVLAYSTAQRTREIGVRMALGAARSDIIRMVLREVLWLAGISIAVAIPISVFLTRLVRSHLFGVSNADPLTLLTTTALISAVAFLAAMVPARRAAKIDPMVALRYE